MQKRPDADAEWIDRQQSMCAQLIQTLGYLNARAFTHDIQTKRGQPDWLACELLIWCIEWYRPGRTLTYRPVLISRDLAMRWSLGERALENARAKLTRLGLVKFRPCHHVTLFDINWDTVLTVAAQQAKREREWASESQCSHDETVDFDPQGESSESSDSRFNGSLPTDSGIIDSRFNGSLNETPVLTGVYKPVDSRFNGSPITPSLGTHSYRPSSSLPSLSEEEEEKVDKVLERGRRRGRGCEGAWVRLAHSAVATELAKGVSLDTVEMAYIEYLDHVADPSRATDLGHWLRGEGLNGKPRDEGDYGNLSWSHWRKVIERRQAKAASASEAMHEEMQEQPRFARGSDGQWYVRYRGQRHPYGIVSGYASEDECRAAWPEWARRHGLQ